MSFKSENNIEMLKQDEIQILNKKSFLVLDTETTGLGESAEIIELAILSKNGEVLFNSLIKPKGRIPIEATAIHGITNDCIKNSPRFSEIVDEVTTLLSKKYIVAHNAKFDSKILNREFEKLNRTLSAKWFCSMLLITPPNSKYLSLSKGLSSLNLSWPKNGNAHRALYDAECARVLINTLIEKTIYKKRICLNR